MKKYKIYAIVILSVILLLTSIIMFFTFKKRNQEITEQKQLEKIEVTNFEVEQEDKSSIITKLDPFLTYYLSDEEDIIKILEAMKEINSTEFAKMELVIYNNVEDTRLKEFQANPLLEESVILEEYNVTDLEGKVFYSVNKDLNYDKLEELAVMDSDMYTKVVQYLVELGFSGF